MLRLTRKVDYAVRVMLALAKKTGQGRISSAEIQAEMLVPHAYLQRIIADLSRSKLIQTYPGPNGGIQLARSPMTISLADVYVAIEGQLLISECTKTPKGCPLDETCPVKSHWEYMQDLLTHEMEAITLMQLAEEAFATAAIK